MPCCCETNLKAIFVLGILGLVFSIPALALGNYAAGIGIVASVCFIVGAKAHNPSAMLVGMIFACIKCIGMIIMAILATVLAVTIAAYNSQEEAAFLRTYKVTANEAMVSMILGVVFAVGDIIFTISTQLHGDDITWQTPVTIEM